ncbi:MAG TPA: glycolate oxidase subunit GlcF [Xanthobacteraceae bacterium]|jgi:glycolate oxidase iron-sulfur subunit|nr:glycolate oxidase subunit GlcF [Xanthobacteraceae bacterium]
MQTSFTLEQLRDPATSESEKILRACVHCGFCTATCPTYVLLGDELDSPRGRIYLIKDMLENNRPATADVVKHVDRCLSCLACMTTCPSGVHYQHLVDHARAHIEETYKRPLPDRLVRWLLAKILPNPRLFRVSMLAALLIKPFAQAFDALGLKRVGAMLRLAPGSLPPSPTRSSVQVSGAQVFNARGPRRGRVAMLAGCVNQVLKPSINHAAINILTRHGIEVVVAAGERCCGALVQHLGRDVEALAFARDNIDVWTREIEGEGLDAILITASGCGTQVKDYGFMLRTDPAYANKAARISGLTKDVSEYLMQLDLAPSADVAGLVVAYHSACSLQHGQRITSEPKRLLAKAGFVVRDIPEGHLCCGSAGTYNMLQPEIARRLAERKAANIEAVEPDVVATGNLGCMTQIATTTAIPIIHTVELLDWATGGEKPAEMGRIRSRQSN